MLAAVWLAPSPVTHAADPVFSGPQPAEKTTPFKVLDLAYDKKRAARNPVTDNAGAPTALVFLPGIELSLVPLLRVLH